MTLKSQTSELSQNAKAFSVESLMGVRPREGDAPGKLTADQRADASGVVAELCCRDLWERFNRIGTEMIVTRAGRRMFPTLKVRFEGLRLTATYVVYMDIVPVSETKYRYNYQRSEWTVVGPSNGDALSGVYVHPGSPATGEVWTSREYVSFDKIKLTNNRKPLMRDQVSLHSMHKYQPRVHILEVLDRTRLDPHGLLEYVHLNRERSETFAFEETAFFTVTAYQNQEITSLKIQSNPFAKGFRDTSNAKREKRDKCPQRDIRLHTALS